MIVHVIFSLLDLPVSSVIVIVDDLWTCIKCCDISPGSS